MSPKIPSLAAGMVLLGLVAPPSPEAKASDGPEGVPPAAAPVPAASDDRPTVLLLTNGKVLQGEVLRDPTGYVLKGKVGVMHFTRASVEKTFRSVEEVYQYKLALTPENDPDERMKLAMWCLERDMKPEARTHLAALVEMNPTDRRARAMLGSLDAPPSQKDSAIRRASVEVPEAAPAELKIDRLREEFAKNPRPSGPPTIFDLAPAMAVRRYGEFAQVIQPILQRRCARCHNEQADLDFQLIQTKSRRDNANDLIVRTNLDAALALVDPGDLARSPLLMASGMAHGAGGKPVLGGPTNPEFRQLSAWVNGLGEPPTRPDGSAPGQPAKGSADPSEAFAAGRRGPVVDPAMPPPPPASRTPRARSPATRPTPSATARVKRCRSTRSRPEP